MPVIESRGGSGEVKEEKGRNSKESESEKEGVDLIRYMQETRRT